MSFPGHHHAAHSRVGSGQHNVGHANVAGGISFGNHMLTTQSGQEGSPPGRHNVAHANVVDGDGFPPPQRRLMATLMPMLILVQRCTRQEGLLAWRARLAATDAAAVKLIKPLSIIPIMR